MTRPRSGARLLLLPTVLFGLLGTSALPAASEERFPSQGAFSANHQWYVEVIQIEGWKPEPVPLAEEDGSELDLDSNEDDTSLPTRGSVSLPAADGQEKSVPPYLVASVYVVGHRFPPLRVSTFRMTEQRLPARLLISDDGRSVTAFQQSDRRGHTDRMDLITFYLFEGSRVGAVSLADLLTDEDLRQIAFTNWGSQLPWTSTEIDEVRGALKLTLDRHLPEELTEEEKIATLEVDLATGRPLQPKRDLLPRPRAILSDATEDWADTASADRDDSNGCTNPWAAALAAGRVPQLSTAELRAQALAAPLPAYTELARKARVSGTVVVELQVGAKGEVESACLVKGLPMGLDLSALDAARRWRFRPFEVEGKPARAAGRLAFEFGWFLAEAESGKP